MPRPSVTVLTPEPRLKPRESRTWNVAISGGGLRVSVTGRVTLDLVAGAVARDELHLHRELRGGRAGAQVLLERARRGTRPGAAAR